MAIVILFLLLVALFFFGLLFSLAVEMLTVRPRAAPDAATSRTQAATRTAEAIPGFLTASAMPPRTATSNSSNDILIDRLQGHLRSEQALVARFLIEPSIDSLYRQSSTPLPVH